MIKNSFNEKIDYVVEGKVDAFTTIIFVHGFGTDKNETQNLFVDIAKKLKDKFRIVRFDLSGYGKSEGKQEEADYEKHAKDLLTVLNWVEKKYHTKIYILAMSMGCFVTALLSPDGVEKTILLSIPNYNTNFIIERVKKRFFTRPGSQLNQKGISLLMRSTGKIQKLGSSFWNILAELKPLDAVNKLASKTKLLIIHPLRDEIIGNKYVDEYKKIPGIIYQDLNGDHSFKLKQDRENMIKKIQEFFLNKIT